MNLKKSSLVIMAGLTFLNFGFTVQNVVLAAKVNPVVKQENVSEAVKKDLSLREKFALLWMKTSAEYRALCYQGYNAADKVIDSAVANKNKSNKPLAIILDCDETVVDNTKGLIARNLNGDSYFDAHFWREFCKSGKSEAMPGARKFLQGVHKKGVEIFYVTGRAAKYSAKESANNFKKLGFPTVDDKHLLMFTTDSNKQPRFDSVEKDYNVILYMGDNLGDFPLGSKGKNLTERSNIVDTNEDNFGTKYIIFPNPVYGSWVSALAKGYMKLSPTEKELVDRDVLNKTYSTDSIAK